MDYPTKLLKPKPPNFGMEKATVQDSCPLNRFTVAKFTVPLQRLGRLKKDIKL